MAKVSKGIQRLVQSLLLREKIVGVVIVEKRQRIKLLKEDGEGDERRVKRRGRFFSLVEELTRRPSSLSWENVTHAPSTKVGRHRFCELRDSRRLKAN